MAAETLDNWKDGVPVIQQGGDGKFGDWKDGAPVVLASPTTTGPPAVAVRRRIKVSLFVD